MEDDNRLNQMQKVWRSRLQTVFWIMVGTNFLMEVFIVIIRIGAGSLDSPSEVLFAILRNILAPTILCSFVCAQMNTVNHSVSPSRDKNTVFILGSLVIVTVITVIHGYLAWIYCLFSIPLIISVGFISKKITRNLLIVLLPLFYISIYFAGMLDKNIVLRDQLVFSPLNISFLVIIYFICNMIIDYLLSNIEIIEKYDRNEENLNHALTLDAMTSLYNHAEFNRVLEKRRYECITFNRYMTLSIVDIDHFKRVNDTYGHANGDKVLINVAHQLLHFCSDKGQVFRYGGEEFAVIFMNKTSEETLETMEELRDSLSKAAYDFLPEGEQVTISVGIYKYGGEENMDVHDIFDHADSSMYEAKLSGRNRCCIYGQ